MAGWRLRPTRSYVRAQIGSSRGSLVTVLLAFLVFGETLGMVQTLGGALVLAAVVTLSRRTA